MTKQAYLILLVSFLSLPHLAFADSECIIGKRFKKIDVEAAIKNTLNYYDTVSIKGSTHYALMQYFYPAWGLMLPNLREYLISFNTTKSNDYPTSRSFRNCEATYDTKKKTLTISECVDEDGSSLRTSEFGRFEDIVEVSLADLKQCR